MAERVVSSLIAKAMVSLAKPAFKKTASWWGARDDLKKLENTVAFIQARVHDAERHQEGENSELIKLWLRKLKQVLYRADDLFDLILTLERQNSRVEKSTLGKVGIIFSKSGPLYNNRRLAHEIKSIKKELDAIKSDMNGLNLSASLAVGLSLPMDRVISNKQTSSFVKAEDVVGRKIDKSIIIGMLFDPIFDVGKRITVIPIVGFGGLGKTTLAQLIFNDEIVQEHFNLATWVCVPEVDNQSTIMRRVYQSFTGSIDSDMLLVGQIKSGIQKTIKDKKCLLVLDDMWDDSRDNWLDLLSLLECSASGSRVIITTRSAYVAKAVGTTEVHNLGLLTEEESWDLFKQFAFRSEQEHSNPDLTQLGKEIVNSCGNVPLSIRVVGCLLYSENSKQHWQQIRNARLSKAKGNKDDNIMQVLKLSYDYLPPALQECFSYCSLFPKDYEYGKNLLVKLWMAQGYVDESSTDIGEQNFMELLEKSLFQDPTEDIEGNFKCKMHDLVHDLAQGIACKEMRQLVEPFDRIYSSNSTDELMHVSVRLEKPKDGGWEAPVSLLAARKMRSLILLRLNFNIAIKSSSLKKMILKFQSLRTLDLEGKNISVVPSSIGKLRHLRYLNLARNDRIKHLPNDVIRLQNLQTLNLQRCFNLTRLPRNFCKLDSLRHLEILWSGLSDLPTGFEKMTSLKELDVYIVGKNNGINLLPPLNFTGNLDIKFSKWRGDAVAEAQRANLKDNKELIRLKLMFGSMEITPDIGDQLDKMLMYLQLPPNMKDIVVQEYKGVEMPRRWLDGLSNLVLIRISYCSNCRVLPHMSRLPHLKDLHLTSIAALEYVEDEDDISHIDGSEAHNAYFPSLEVLTLSEMRSLKGWTRPSKDDDDGEPRHLLFPRLLKMNVSHFSKLMSMPLAPKLESLRAQMINWKVFESNLSLVDDAEASSSAAAASSSSSSAAAASSSSSSAAAASSSSSSAAATSSSSSSSAAAASSSSSSSAAAASSSSSAASSTTLFTSLKELDISTIEDGPASLSVSSRFSNLQSIQIGRCDELTSLIIESSSPIRYLHIYRCNSLKSISVGSIFVLETLIIHGGDNDLEVELSRSIACLTTLQKLEMNHFNTLKQLPGEMGNLSLLRELKIDCCPKMESLPQSLLGLTSLQKLHINQCPGLKERYEKPNGQDCHLLQHIPLVKLD